MNPRLQAAKEYARRDWRVIPNYELDPSKPTGCACREKNCTHPGKHPRVTDWPAQATTHEGTLDRWWKMWPESNVGIVTGEGSGFWALDVDGEDGEETLADLERSYGPLPHTAEQVTGGGGRHLLFRYVPGLKNEVKFAPGLDVRTDGGQIVVEPSEHASGRSYAWEASHHPDDVPIAEAPEWLIAVIQRAGGQEKRRAAPVADKIPKGQRDKTLASLAGTMRRRGMGEGEILAALLVTNKERCEPPLAESNVRKIAASIATYPANDTEPALSVNPTRQRDTKNGAGGFSAHSDSKNEILNQARGQAQSPFSALSAPNNDLGYPAPMAEEAYHGIVGELVRALEPETEADPHVLLTNALVVAGNLIGNGPYTCVGATFHHLVLFKVDVGRSSKGRKGTGLDPIQRIAEAVDPVWAKEHMPSGLSSGEGLIHHVRDRVEKRRPVKDEKGHSTGEYENVVEDEGVEDKRVLVCESEFASPLKVAGREGNNLSAVIRQAWDGKTLQILTKNSPARASRTHISIIGHITQEELHKHLSETEIANGFGNRFLWVCSRRSKLLPEGGTWQPLNDVVARLRRIIETTREPRHLKRNPAATQVWAAIYPTLSREEVGLYGAITGRAEAQVLRLSALYAVLDGKTVIEVPHLLAAVAVWEYCEASARYLFGDSTGNTVADGILTALKRAPAGLTRLEFRNYFSGHVSKETTSRALEFLQSLGRIVREERREEGKKGRPAEVWSLHISASSSRTHAREEGSKDSANGDSNSTLRYGTGGPLLRKAREAAAKCAEPEPAQKAH